MLFVVGAQDSDVWSVSTAAESGFAAEGLAKGLGFAADKLKTEVEDLVRGMQRYHYIANTLAGKP